MYIHSAGTPGMRTPMVTSGMIGTTPHVTPRATPRAIPRATPRATPSIKPSYVGMIVYHYCVYEHCDSKCNLVITYIILS